MNEVVDSVRRVTAIVGAIAEASREQSDGIEQVNVAIGQMDEVTQKMRCWCKRPLLPRNRCKHRHPCWHR